MVVAIVVVAVVAVVGIVIVVAVVIALCGGGVALVGSVCYGVESVRASQRFMPRTL